MNGTAESYSTCQNSSAGSKDAIASKAPRERKQLYIHVTIVLLDNTKVNFKVNRRDSGQVLLDLIFQHMLITEDSFFGLRFPSDIPDSMLWLDPSKSIRKQFKHGFPHVLLFRVKFYATDLSSIKTELTRYLLFLQIRLDFLENRLQGPVSVVSMIASFTLQAIFGDYDTKNLESDYISKFRFLQDQTDDFKSKLSQLHIKHKGMSSLQAQCNVINMAQKLEMYGVEIHVARDNNGESLEVGVTSSGIVIYQNGHIISQFKWPAIVKISFKRNDFFVQLRSPHAYDMKTELTYSFQMDNYRTCKRLWKSCVDFHSFYRHDRCIKSLLGHANSVNNVLMNQFENKHSNSLNLSESTSIQNIDSGLNKGTVNAEKNHDNVFHVSSVNSELPHSINKFVTSDILSSIYEVPSSDNLPIAMHSPDSSLAESFKQVHCDSQDDAINSKVILPDSVQSNHINNHKMSNSIEEAYYDQSSILSASSLCSHPTTNGVSDGKVFIKIKPDSNGNYGFSLKGGVDLNLPVTVSKVEAGSPASMCIPRVYSGDRVLQINGQDVSKQSHEQILQTIQFAQHVPPQQLVLQIQPFVCTLDEEPTEEFLEPLPVSTTNPVDFPKDNSPLESSMQWMQDMIDSGELLTMFEALYRKKPGATMNDARLPSNVPKNRYRDISPYDKTRIHLRKGTTDYINANFVNMSIPNTDCTNRYIASQGPLLNTTIDFWTMIWELEVTFVVMLTTIIERGRPKCHQYWPDAGTSIQFGPWKIESLSEEVTPSFAYRDFKLHYCKEEGLDEKSIPARLIRQMQYIAWPDHGVPDDSSDFLKFVLQVRKERQGMSAPCVVHCSAGIGRTGVLITMETAMCLIEANQPIDPIEITRTMRDQRAMMIQTPSQFKFVCEAILKVYYQRLSKVVSESSESNELKIFESNSTEIP